MIGQTDIAIRHEPLAERADHKFAQLRAGAWWSVADLLQVLDSVIESTRAWINERGHRALDRACARSERKGETS